MKEIKYYREICVSKKNIFSYFKKFLKRVIRKSLVFLILPIVDDINKCNREIEMQIVRLSESLKLDVDSYDPIVDLINENININDKLYNNFNYIDVNIINKLKINNNLFKEIIIKLAKKNSQDYQFYCVLHRYINDLMINDTIYKKTLHENAINMTSCICRKEHWNNSKFNDICKRLQLPKDYHRKTWEWVFICLVLEEMNMLQDNKKGIGFAVGNEPLPAFFASKGCKILATDILPDSNDVAKIWLKNNQNANGNLESLRGELCPEDIFYKNVNFREVDMNIIPEDLYNKFDFCWSSCAIEHVGSLEKSKAAIKNIIKVLKPGGVAIHTTELNLSSNTDTIMEGDSVIWRECDIAEIIEYFNNNECHVEEMDWSLGNEPADMYVDQPPYYWLNEPVCHLKLNLEGYITTSVGLIIKKI